MQGAAVHLESHIPLVYRRPLVGHEAFLRMLESRDYLAAHFSEPLTLREAAYQACLSPFHYQRLFYRTFGETPHDFITRRRLEHAKRLLVVADLTVSEICLEVGYQSLGSFSTRFSKAEGCAPTEFRRVFSLPGLWSLKSVPGCFRFMHQLRPECSTPIS